MTAASQKWLQLAKSGSSQPKVAAASQKLQQPILVHKGYQFSCDQSRKDTLKQHIQAVHKVLWFSCGHCEYASARKYNLKQHIQSVHDAIKCFFYQCDYEPTCKTHLKIHMQYIHKGFNISLVVINGNMNLLGRII